VKLEFDKRYTPWPSFIVLRVHNPGTQTGDRTDCGRPVPTHYDPKIGRAVLIVGTPYLVLRVRQSLVSEPPHGFVVEVN
jgi:hypothetical protein